MSSIRVSGNTSGHYDLTVPDVAGQNTIPLDRVVTTDTNGHIQISGGSTNNDDSAAVITAASTEHAKIRIDTSSTINHRATLALESGSYEVNIATSGLDEMRFSTQNTSDALFIGSNGNIGIGTSSLAQKLVVSGGTSDVSVLFNSTDTAYHNFGITKSGSLVKMGEFNNGGDTHSFPILSIEMNGDKVRVGDSTIGNELLNVTFNGRGGIQVGSKTGEGAYIVLDGPNNGDGAGGDYSYIEHDSLGRLNFNVGNSSSGTTTRMAIHPEGYILNDQPRFATTINYVSGFRSTGVISNWRSPHVNQGGHFNASNGRFTAPVAGTYRFEFHDNVLRDGTGVYYLEWYKNGSGIAGSVGGRIYDQWDGGWANACGFVVMDLAVNDFVEFWHTGGSITLDGNSYGQYCGYLLG